MLEGKAHEVALTFDLDPDIVKGLIMVESGWDTWSCRYEPHWKWFLNPKNFAALVNVSTATETVCQQMSWGLMQVMGAVARELGFNQDLSKLCDPDYGLKYGCMKLKKNLERFGTMRDALAAYNAGVPSSKVGQAYAEKVLTKSLTYTRRAT